VFSGTVLGWGEKIASKLHKLVRNWTLLNSSEDAAQLEIWVRELEVRGTRPE
jgi:hypothetical protein